MRRVRCYECGKSYDYDEDDFCPKCGAFNQPPRGTAIGADGSVIRREGLNERNHKDSFAHAEFHEENRERRASGLSKGVKRTARGSRPPVQTSQKRQNTSEKKNPVSIVVWIIFAIIALNILSNFFFLFF